MSVSLQVKRCLTYGTATAMGKVTAVFLLLASPLMAEPVTVLAMGDSLTQGYGLPADEGFVPRLEAWLQARGEEVKIINGGVSGDTSTGGAARVAWSLTPEVDAMIVTLGGNDFLRGIDPAVTRASLEAILREAEARKVQVMLIGMHAPANFGPEYKARFDALYPELAAAYGTLYCEDFFAGLGEETPDALQAFFQPDGLHPNAEGVVRIVAAIGPGVQALIARAK